MAGDAASYQMIKDEVLAESKVPLSKTAALRWLNPSSRGMSARGAWECVWAHAVHISGYSPRFGAPPGHMKRFNGVPATGPAPTALLARQVPLGDMARG